MQEEEWLALVWVGAGLVMLLLEGIMEEVV